ncbi:MAG: oxidoreductase [Candidatus Goldiibacteriota bacterium HGW-Goldbacteria-1]|jgi:NAD(P)-dependent dehydrogenase (short-subunit alcohol dehydrogenase family)|nr:MAG: oxidoreductase [Candidatus Goldiibacteriota bacterium HGW-Goldbacteria-1]
MKNKTVIITGGAQGIGRGMVQEFMEDKWNVMMADIDGEAALELLDAMNAGNQLSFCKCDVSAEAEVEKLIKGCAAAFGSVDAIINNAGIGNNKPVTELTLAEWNRVMGVNLTSIFLTAKYGAPHLKKNKGAIVNMASTRALMSEPNTEAYSATKGGVVALTHSLAVSLGPDVRVNCISPGWIEVSDFKKKRDFKEPVHSEADKTQHPAGRVGVPSDIAQLALYLVSDKAGFITGQNFVVDGGMTKKMIYK